MSYCLTSAGGAIEAVIDDNCGMKKFLSVAHVLVKDCRVKFISKEDNSDTIDWSFKYKGHPLILHYNIYNGVSIFNKSSQDNKVVTELALILEKKFF